jgi:hypothetical protein
MKRVLVNVLALLASACASWLVYTVAYPEDTMRAVPWYFVPLLFVGRVVRLAILCGLVALILQRLVRRLRSARPPE